MRKYEYLVHYYWKNRLSDGTGTIVITVSGKQIRTWNPIDEIREYIRRTNSCELVLVTGYQLLRTKYFG